MTLIKTLIAPGVNANVLERPNTTVQASQTPTALAPISRLTDGRPSQMFIFDQVAEDDYVEFDINQLLNGSFDSWTAGTPDDMTVNLTGTGAVTEETVSPLVSGSALEMTNGSSGTVEVLPTKIVGLSGEKWKLFVNTQSSNADSPCEIEIFNPITGKYLTAAGAWSARKQNAFTFAETTFGARTGEFTVEAIATTHLHEVELQVRLHMDGAAASRTHHYDDLFLVPAVNLGGVLGHNLTPRITPRLVSSDEALATVPVDRAFRFDGTNDWLKRNTAFSGLANGKQGTASFWVRFRGGDGTKQQVLNNDGQFTIFRETTGTLRIFADSPTQSGVLSMTSSGVNLVSGPWHHVLATWDLANSSGEIRIDGVDRTGGTTFVDDEIDYVNNGEFLVGANDGGTNILDAELSEVWFDPTSSIDISVTANERFFRTAGGKAAVLGDNGELPTGTSPILYWKGDEPLTNSGTGGDFDTENGSLVSSVTLESEMALNTPTFYTHLASDTFRRFWKWHFRGTNPNDSIALGELVLTRAAQIARSPRQRGLEVASFLPQEAAETRLSREQWRVRRGKWRQRIVQLQFRHTASEQAAFIDEMLIRTKDGVDPLIIVVRDDRADSLVHARKPVGETSFTVQSHNSELTEMTLVESAFGVVFD